MKDETDRPRGEMDVLKFYIWLMLLMTVAVAGFYWKMSSDVEDVQKNLKQGQTWMPEFAKQGADIEAMLKVHKTNAEDEAREQAIKWFSTIWRKRGIANESMVPGQWKVPPISASKGTMRYFEEQYDIGFNSRNPLSREAIAAFCYEVEKSSTRLRVIDLDIRRTDKENFEKDAWSGKAVIGYRHAKTD